MITFNELSERAKSELLVVHTPTEEQAITLLKALDEKGYTWFYGEKLTDITRYEKYKENTCYDFTANFRHILSKMVCVSPLGLYQEYGYAIIEFKDIEWIGEQL